jgi:PqqA peptide cyclase
VRAPRGSSEARPARRLRDALARTVVLAHHARGVASAWVGCHLHRSPGRLPILLLSLTNRCNLRCKMCGVLEPDVHRGDELTTDEWKAVLGAARRLGTILVSITGGEALLRPDLFEIIRHAHQLGMAVHLCTNGTMINERVAQQLRDARVDTVSISLESSVAQVHDALRGDGTFHSVVQSLRALAPDVRVGINCLITAQNYKSAAAMIPFAESLHVQQIKFAPIHTNLQHRRKPREELVDLVFAREELDDLELEVQKIMAAARRSPLLTNSTRFLAGITRLYDRPRRFRCYAGYATCAIDPVGVVTPCWDVESTLSVHDRPLDAIWRSEEFDALRRRVHRCASPCWDTTNAELSLRLSARSLLGQIGQTWRDASFYLDAVPAPRAARRSRRRFFGAGA